MIRLSLLLAFVASTAALPTPDTVYDDDDVCYLEDDLVELILSLPEGPDFCRDLIHILPM